MDDFTETLRTYDLNASEFAEQWWDNRLQRQMDLFQATFDGDRVVDLGCGAGRDTQWLDQLGYDTIGVDLSWGMLSEARQRFREGRFVHGDLLSLPLASHSADGAWACSSLVHLPPGDTLLALGEIARVLRPGGGLYLGLEAGEGGEWRVEASGARRRYHLWQPDDLVRALGDAGFMVEECFTERVKKWNFLTVIAVRT